VKRPVTPVPLGTTRRRGPAARALAAVEASFDRAFPPSANPWRHLGALGYFLFWVVAVSGVYVYVLFDTAVAGAHASVERMTHDPWYLGGLMRSLHRYASDALVVIMALHLAKEWVRGHAHGYRWFSWVSGVALVWLAYASGIGGYWLVWDRQAQFSLVATMEWLDWLGIFGEPLTRNFLTPESVDDRLFSLLIFMHIGFPIALLAGMWVHVQRISWADTQPPRPLAWGTLGALVALSLAWPATSQAPADLALAPSEVGLDWFYLYLHPLMYATSEGGLWAVTGALTLALVALPWLSRGGRVPVARVDLANCNGCGRCASDCPYAAVVMVPRVDGRPHAQQARVLASLCAGCGICAGACPSSTPFRSARHLASGIDLPPYPVARLREDLLQRLAGLTGETRIVVFGCGWTSELGDLARPDTAVLPLVCTGMLPPSFIEYALRGGADGVLVTGCQTGDCEYRLGNAWVEARVAGEREPRLRASVPRERLRILWAGPGEAGRVREALAELRSTLAALDRAPARRRIR
jgi:coenzyme F420-reducing hydrogenase delta subunit/ferredoxin